MEMIIRNVKSLHNSQHEAIFLATRAKVFCTYYDKHHKDIRCMVYFRCIIIMHIILSKYLKQLEFPELDRILEFNSEEGPLHVQYTYRYIIQFNV